MGDKLGSDQPTPGRAAGVGGDRAEIGDEAVSLLSLVNAVLRMWRVVVAFTLTGAVLTLVVVIINGPAYVAESKFIPQSSGTDASRFAGLAAQFGIAVGGVSQGESLEFYAELVESRELLAAAVQTEYRFATNEMASDSLSGTLIELFDIDGDQPAMRLRSAVDELSERVTVGVDLAAHIVVVRVSAPWRDLAAAINRRLLELVTEFNLEKRQFQAREEREFVEARVRDAQEALFAAEADLQMFLQQNRRFEGPSELSFEHGRLQRRVELRQQVYVSLAQALEQARIEEVRNTPVISVVDSPEAGTRRRGGRMVMLLMGSVVGAMIGCLIALGRDYLAKERVRNSLDYQEFEALRRAAIADVLRGRLLAIQAQGERVRSGSGEP